jgi:hypothetical protein
LEFSAPTSAGLVDHQHAGDAVGFHQVGGVDGQRVVARSCAARRA